MTRRDRAGSAAVDTVLKSSGRLGGYSVVTQLTLRLRNEWTADDGKLSEKIVISAELGHTDKTPGRRMQRLNDLNLKLRQAISMTTGAQDGPLTFADSVTLDFKMDGNDLAAGSAQLSVRVGGEELAVQPEAVQVREATAQELAQAVQEAVLDIASGVWAQLDAQDRGKISSGL